MPDQPASRKSGPGDSWGVHWHKSVNERALSAGDLGHTCEGMRKKKSVEDPKHCTKWCGRLIQLHRGVGVIRERSPLKTCGTSQVSCHDLDDPVGFRPRLDRQW